MIAYLKGQILKKTEKALILDTGNIGYLVHLDKKTLSEIEQNNEVEFFIHSQVREDAFDLYGFLNYEELQFFKSLIAINGIGPKVALEIMNVPINKIKTAIINEDSGYISKIPGIGPKTAKRLILELKNKIDLENIEDLSTTNSNETANSEAIEALIKLGYQRHHVVRTLQEIPIELTEAEEIVTYFLKNS